jgi:hypothetical protein
MAIYDKYNGLPWKSTSSSLIMGTANSISFEFTNNSILENLKDNEEHYLTPKYLRDMFISLWDSNVFKPTTTSGSNIEYIGIDSGISDDLLLKPNRDLEVNKILIGKRSYSGTQSYLPSHDIMSDKLVSSDIDLFFTNTKLDIDSQRNTRVVFLAGTNTNLFTTAPYLQAQVLSTPNGSQSLSFDIVNSSTNGDINFYSHGIDHFGNDVNIGGIVSINDVVFPTIATSSNSSTNGRVLIDRNSVLNWEIIKFPQRDYIGITGSLLNIHGTPVNLNNYSLEFTDSRPIPIPIGDITLGVNFDKMSIAEVLEKIIYPYLAPKCTISLNNSNGYVEVGSYPNIKLNYSITKRTLKTLPTKFTNMIPSTYPPITNDGQTTVSGIVRGIVISPVTATMSTFTIKVNDGTTSNSASTSISGIYPYFYGFTSSNTLTVFGLESMTKVVEPKGDKTFDLIGSGNFFFAYDSDYGPLNSIINQDNIDIFATFSTSTKILSSPTGLWASKEYIIYKWSNVTQIGPPSENFDFKY